MEVVMLNQQGNTDPLYRLFFARLQGEEGVDAKVRRLVREELASYSAVSMPGKVITPAENKEV
jgi:hypothetical protein